jgi:NDP-sugar pyrophosphorylase family protein
VFVCSAALMDAIEAVYRQTGDASLSEGVQTLAAAGNMQVIDIGDGFWQDVDTPEMLAHAEAELARRKN